MERTNRFNKQNSFAAMIVGGLILGAGVLGAFRIATAEPIQPALLPSVAEPRANPNDPTLPVPMLPLMPTLPEPPRVPELAVPVAAPPMVPALPEVKPLVPVPDFKVDAPPKVPELTRPELPILPAPTPIPELPKTKPTPPMPALPVLPEVAPKPMFVGNEIAPLPMPTTPEVVALPTPAPPPIVMPMLPEFKPAQPVQPEINLKPEASGNTLNNKVPASGIVPEPLPFRSATPVPTSPGIATPTSFAPGDSIMRLPARETFLSAVMGVALATAAPSPALAQEPPAGPKVMEPTVQDLKKEVETLKNELDSVKRLQGTLEETVLGRKDGKILVPSDKGLFRLMTDLETSVKKLEVRMKKLEEAPGAVPAKTTTEASPLTSKPETVSKGTLKLENAYNVNVSIIVNGISHALEPQQIKDVEVTAGSFSYELIGANDAKRTSTIREGETVTLRIR